MVGTASIHSPLRGNLGPPAGDLIPVKDSGELMHVGDVSMRNAMATVRRVAVM